MNLSMKIQPLVSTLVLCTALLAAVLVILPFGAQQAGGAQLLQETTMNNNWNTTTSQTPRIDAQQPAEFETATFAVG